MIIIGVDPGYAIVGIGVTEYAGNKFRTLEYGAITTPAGMNTVDRLKKIYDEMTMYIEKYSMRMDLQIILMTFKIMLFPSKTNAESELIIPQEKKHEGKEKSK